MSKQNEYSGRVSEKEFRELVRSYQNAPTEGEKKDALDKAFTRLKPYILDICFKTRGSLSQEDAFAAASEGFMIAMSAINPDYPKKGVFSMFWFYVKNQIKLESMNNMYRYIKPSYATFVAINRIHFLQGALTADLGRAPTVEEISDASTNPEYTNSSIRGRKRKDGTSSKPTFLSPTVIEKALKFESYKFLPIGKMFDDGDEAVEESIRDFYNEDEYFVEDEESDLVNLAYQISADMFPDFSKIVVMYMLGELSDVDLEESGVSIQTIKKSAKSLKTEIRRKIKSDPDLVSRYIGVNRNVKK